MNRYLYIFVFFLIFFAFGCDFQGGANKSKPLVIWNSEPVKINETNPPRNTVSPLDSMSIDSLWNYLVFQKGGCLTGGQYVVNGSFGNEGCVMTSERVLPDWTPFFTRDKKELTSFLVEQLSDTSKTHIHTCPCFTATAGETAVYCLQNLYKKNWYDLPPFLSYQDREGSGCMDHPQAWLQSILADEKQCEVMKKAWLKESD